MKLLSYSLVLLFLVTKLTGQSAYAPLGAYWNYDYVSHDGGEKSHWTIQVTKDTIINGIVTKTLTKYYNTWFSLPPNPPPGYGSAPFGVIEQRSDSVIFYEPWAYPGYGKFLYSFNMNVGDTIHIMAMPDFFAVVDSLSNITLNSFTVKKWKLTTYCGTNTFSTTTIIENIGPVNDYLRWNSDGCVIGGGTWTFKCYNSSSLTFNQPCLNVGLKTISPEKQDLLIYPVPANDILQLKSGQILDEVTLEIININMEVIIHEKYKTFSDETIHLDKLVAGEYMIRLRSAAGVVAKKIAVIR